MVNLLTKEKIEAIMDKIRDKADFFVACVDWGTNQNKNYQISKLHMRNY